MYVYFSPVGIHICKSNISIVKKQYQRFSYGDICHSD